MFSATEIVMAAATVIVSQEMKDVWTWIYVIGIGAFYISVLLIVPQGCRDLFALLKDIDSFKDSAED